MLIKLSAGDIRLGKPIDFAVYSGDGKLLLQQGYVVDSEGLLERLYRLGHREGTAARARTGIPSTIEPSPTGDTDRNQLLFGTVNLDRSQPDENPTTSKKSPSLPNLRQKVEFFHLTRDGGTDALRMELAGVIPDEALIARHTRQDAPALATGMVYEARLFTGSRVFKFATRLLPESSGPLGCHFLKYPEVVSQAIVRRQHRVPTSIIGQLHTNEYQRPATDVLVENVSSIGVGISAEQDFLIVGQSARLAMNLSIDSRTRHVEVVVEVRNRRQEGGCFKYGLQIVQVPDEGRRDIKDFVLESVAAT
ncbi:PilZ domain-containing protein [Trinickia mobilis]|uniref:PilZ domain-containing protein n=1 Tax=Trinickia mobilis TaxID=2816356 RepID=UPI001A8C870C|nr:PilZ domain-containing protein [Trinickia mobilis]